MKRTVVRKVHEKHLHQFLEQLHSKSTTIEVEVREHNREDVSPWWKPWPEYKVTEANTYNYKMSLTEVLEDWTYENTKGHYYIVTVTMLFEEPIGLSYVPFPLQLFEELVHELPTNDTENQTKE